MRLKTQCPECGEVLTATPEELGSTGRCDECGCRLRFETPVSVRLPPRKMANDGGDREPAPANNRDDDSKSGYVRPGTRPQQPARKPWALIAAGVFGVLAALGVGGYLLLGSGKPKVEEPEVAAAPKPKLGTTPKKDQVPKKVDPVTPAAEPPAVPKRPADPLTPVEPPPPTVNKVKLDGPVTKLFTGGAGRYALFYIPTLTQLTIYDVAEKKVAATVGKVSSGTLIVPCRSYVFLARRTDGRIDRVNIATGEREEVKSPFAGMTLHDLHAASGADDPLVAVVLTPQRRYQAWLLDPETLAPCACPIEDPQQADVSFPLTMNIGSNARVSGNGRAITLSDRLYTRTQTGYRAVAVNPSSALHPSPDGRVACGNHVACDDGRHLKFEPPGLIRWFIPAAAGPFFLSAEYGGNGFVRPRLMLHAEQNPAPLGELRCGDALRDILRGGAGDVIALSHRAAFFPDPGVVVIAPDKSEEVTFVTVDMPELLAASDRDVVFTSVAPATASTKKPYTHTATAVARDGSKPSFTLTAGPSGMVMTPEGHLTWTPEAEVQGAADVTIAARTPAGKVVTQRFQVFMPHKKGEAVAVAPPMNKNPLDPKVPDNPNPMKQVGKAVELPGPVTAVAVGGAGRLICLYISSTRQVAVFDAAEKKVVKYIPVAGNNALIAAGLEKLFVLTPDEGAVQRWDLKSFTKEATGPLEKGVVKSALMGSASTGPLWLFSGERIAIFDTKTLKPTDIKTDAGFRNHGLGEGLRVSADGRTAGTWRFGTSPSGLTVLSLADRTIKSSYQHDSVGHVTPGPDGRVIHTAVGRFTPEGKEIGKRDGGIGMGSGGTAYSFPAAEGGSLYLNITLGGRGGRPLPGDPAARLSVHWAADGRKLADLPDVEVGAVNVWDREPIGNDQRFMLMPSAKLLVALPETNDKLLLYPFDLDDLLEKTGKDYLLVDAPPRLVAARGEAFTHSLVVKSKKGGVKVKLDSGPTGMTVTPAGAVTWAVPRAFAENDAIAILTVSDASGQEVLQTLRLDVVRADLVPKKNPVDPKKGPDPKADEPVDPRKGPDPKVDDPADAPAKDEPVTVKLPGAVREVVVGGGGRLLILTLPKEKQIAVFDVAKGKVVKYLPAAEEDVKIAAGLEHLFVANPSARVIQRYSLKTFEKEATLPQPVDGAVAGLCMGSASKGPLLVCPKGDQWGAKPVFVDPIKMKVLPGGDQLPAAAAPFMRASADGRMFGWRNGTGSEGHDMSLVEFADGKPKARTFSAGTSLLLPSPDARYVYCYEGVFNAQFKKLYPDKQNQYDRPFLPAATGGMFMQLEPGGKARFPGDPQATPGPGRINFFLPGQYRPFGTLEKIDGLTSEAYGYGAVPDPVMHDRRVHLFPDAGRVVTIPTTNDKLILHPFGLEDMLTKSGADYLIITSEPPADVARGTKFTYAPVVRSKKGGAKIKLDSGPEGMTIADGKLTWAVPADLTDKEADVILTVTDGTGQEVFHTFKLAVRDPLPGEDATPAPKADPKPEPKADPKTDPKEDPKPEPKADPKVEPRVDPKAPAGADPKDAKPIDLTLKPAALQKDEQTVNLPSAATQVIPAAGGRFLIAHLPKDRKLAVLDTAEAKVVKYIPVAEEDAKIAAGATHLVVFLPGANLIQRWNLATLEKEATVTNPIDKPVKTLAMGSASDGPLVVVTKSAANAFESPTLLLFDPKTFKKSEYMFGEGGRGAGAFHPQYPPEVRVSANGTLITAWVLGLSPSGVYHWARSDKVYKGGHRHESWGTLTPSPDGRTIYAGGKHLPVDGKDLLNGPPGTVIPAIHGQLVLSLSAAEHGGKQVRASVHLDREARPLITLPELNGLTATADRFGRTAVYGMESRVFLIPDAKLLAVLAETGDKIILHRFDLDSLLEKSDVDYLFVTSRPPATTRGDTFRYSPTVRSKKGGVKLTLDSGPDGMKLSDGSLTWDVPKDFDGESVSVIVTVTDKTGQEVFHTFTLPVGAPAQKPPKQKPAKID